MLGFQGWGPEPLDETKVQTSASRVQPWLSVSPENKAWESLNQEVLQGAKYYTGHGGFDAAKRFQPT